MAALGIIYPYTVSHRILNSFQHGDIAGRGAVIVSNQRFTAVRVRSDNADCVQFFLTKRQRSVIFQQNHALSCHFLSQFQMLLTFHYFIRNLIVFIFIKAAQQKSGGKKPFRCLGNFLFRNHTLLISLQQMQISYAAVYIAAGFQR